LLIWKNVQGGSRIIGQPTVYNAIPKREENTKAKPRLAGLLKKHGGVVFGITEWWSCNTFCVVHSFQTDVLKMATNLTNRSACF
jgi:hypothetical protein